MSLESSSNSYTPYGPWTTVGLAAAVVMGSSILAGLMLQMVGVTPDPDTATSGTMAWSVISDLLGIAALAKLVDLRAPGQAAPYLAVRPFATADAKRWLAVMAAFFLAEWIIEAVLRPMLDMPAPPNWLDNANLSPLLLMALVITGPIYEELLFRGFVLEGLAPTPLGASGSLVLSTLAWTMLHWQYDTVSLIMVFGSGLLFGLARLATGSLLLAILLHMTWNAVSMLMNYA
jgi:membrane protease YdiL (CAAX protease family)